MSETTNILIGKEAASLDVSPQFEAYSGVEIITGAKDANDNDIVYTDGDVTGTRGRVLTINNPWGTQAQATAILNSLKSTGFQYQPYKASDVLLNPAAEIGDGVTISDTYSGIYSVSKKFSRQMKADIGAPEDEEIDHEYPYESKQDRVYQREIGEAKTAIKVNANAIVLEAQRATEAEGSLSSRITTNANEITATVSQISNVDANVKSDNLIPYPYYQTSRTVYGITWTVNSLGGVKINGTATSDAWFFVTRKSSQSKNDAPDLKLLSGKTYTLSMSGGASNVAGVKVGIEHGVDGNSPTAIAWINSTKKSASFSYAAGNDSHIVDVVIYVAQGTTVSNQTLNVQLEYGDTAHSWQSPTVGTNTTKSGLEKHEATLTIQATEIAAKVSQSGGSNSSNSFSWSLTSTGHNWYANGSYNPVLSITKSGLSVNGSGTFSGKITASSGTIGGFTISSDRLYNGVQYLNDTSHEGVYIGTNGITCGKGAFKVTSSGAVTASNLTLTGGSIKIGNNFKVDSSGNVTANNMKLTGTLNVGGTNITAAVLQSGAQSAYNNGANWSSAYTSTSAGGFCYGGAVNGNSAKGKWDNAYNSEVGAGTIYASTYGDHHGAVYLPGSYGYTQIYLTGREIAGEYVRFVTW